MLRNSLNETNMTYIYFTQSACQSPIKNFILYTVFFTDKIYFNNKGLFHKETPLTVIIEINNSRIESLAFQMALIPSNINLP